MPTIDHIGGGLAEAGFKLCAWRTNDSKLKRIRDPLPLDEHLAHHRVHVVMHRAFDGIGLQDERLAPTLDYPPQAMAVLAPEVRIRHMAHQPGEDPERLAEKPQAERELLQGMGPQGIVTATGWPASERRGSVPEWPRSRTAAITFRLKLSSMPCGCTYASR